MTKKQNLPEDIRDLDQVDEDHPLYCEKCSGRGWKTRGYVGGDDNPTWPGDAKKCYQCNTEGKISVAMKIKNIRASISGPRTPSRLDHWAERIERVCEELEQLQEYLSKES